MSRARGDSFSQLQLDESSSEADHNLKRSNQVPFYKFVLTGGPCGGKTTALARLSSYLRERGFEVMICPEAYTLLGNNGFSPSYFAVEGIDTVVQSTVLSLQETLENGMEYILRARGLPSVVLCDRGQMDGLAYMDEAKFRSIYESKGLTVADLREGRYNAVFHMVTAAEGAERFYSLDNNDVRTETPEEARQVDKNVQAAWVGHPRLIVFDNSTDFEGKLQRLVEATAKLVGLPTNLSRYTAKFLLKELPNLDDFTVDYHVFKVEKVYLVSSSSSETSDEYTFIRKRTTLTKDGREGGSAYGLTIVSKSSNSEEGQPMVERKRIITSREWMSSFRQRDPTRHIVKQRRISFLYKHQSFNIHIYEEPVQGLSILHAQVETASAGEQEVELPPFLSVERRLQHTPEDETQYGAYSLSTIKGD